MNISNIRLANLGYCSVLHFKFNGTFYSEYVDAENEFSLTTNQDSHLKNCVDDVFSNDEITEIHEQLENWLINYRDENVKYYH